MATALPDTQRRMGFLHVREKPKTRQGRVALTNMHAHQQLNLNGKQKHYRLPGGRIKPGAETMLPALLLPRGCAPAHAFWLQSPVVVMLVGTLLRA